MTTQNTETKMFARLMLVIPHMCRVKLANPYFGFAAFCGPVRSVKRV